MAHFECDSLHMIGLHCWCIVQNDVVSRNQRSHYRFMGHDIKVVSVIISNCNASSWIWLKIIILSNLQKPSRDRGVDHGSGIRIVNDRVSRRSGENPRIIPRLYSYKCEHWTIFTAHCVKTRYHLGNLVLLDDIKLFISDSIAEN